MFEEDITFGKTGEEIVWLALLNNPQTKQVVDVRKDKYFQANDVDFLQILTNGKCNKIEIKTDRKAHETGNIVYETKSNENLGCLERTIADYIIYCLSGNGNIYCFNPQVVKKYIEFTNPKEIDMGDGAKGYLLDIEDLMKKKVIKELEK